MFSIDVYVLAFTSMFCFDWDGLTYLGLFVSSVLVILWKVQHTHEFALDGMEKKKNKQGVL